MNEWVNEIKIRAKTGKFPVSAGRSKKINVLNFESLVFAPSQLGLRPIDYFKNEIKSDVVIGKSSKNPVILKSPIMIAAMSFGALSREAKIALAKGSKLAGTSANTGEGGLLPEERTESDILVVQYSTGRFGVDDEYLKAGDMIEVKIGQGAKPNQGGLLPADKVTEEIAKVRHVPMGEDVHSPPYHPDIHNIEELKARIEELRTKYEKPIILKLGATAVEKDVELAIQANPDVIAIDGIAGGTAAAPKIMLDDFAIPTMVALVRARKVMDKLGAKQELIIAGGLNTGADVAKALSLGADAVYMGFPMLVALGCGYCKTCYLGSCPYGITTQDETLRSKLNVDEKAQSVANFINACTEEVKMAAAAFGYDDINKLNKDCVKTISYEVHKITGIDTV